MNGNVYGAVIMTQSPENLEKHSEKANYYDQKS